MRALGLAVALLGAGAPLARAVTPLSYPGRSSNERPALLSEIGFDQKLGAALPLDAPFRDEAGRAVRLGDYFGRRPVVLTLVYFDCPMLCTVSLNGLTSALDVLPFEPGRDFEILSISFEPKEQPAQAAARKKALLARYRRPGAERGWHLLTGERESIDRVTRAVGFRYAWDEETRQYAHPAGTVVATADGRVSRYLFGIEYAPKDLRLALVDSGQGKLGGLVDQALLFCYQYNPHSGRYSAAILNVLKAAAALTVLALGGFILTLRRRERAEQRRRAAPLPTP
jgi:protein SCO1/2